MHSQSVLSFSFILAGVQEQSRWFLNSPVWPKPPGGKSRFYHSWPHTHSSEFHSFTSNTHQVCADLWLHVAQLHTNSNNLPLLQSQILKALIRACKVQVHTKTCSQTIIRHHIICTVLENNMLILFFNCRNMQLFFSPLFPSMPASQCAWSTHFYPSKSLTCVTHCGFTVISHMQSRHHKLCSSWLFCLNEPTQSSCSPCDSDAHQEVSSVEWLCLKLHNFSN